MQLFLQCKWNYFSQQFCRNLKLLIINIETKYKKLLISKVFLTFLDHIQTLRTFLPIGQICRNFKYRF